MMKIFYAQADFGGCGFYRIMQPSAFMKFVLNHEVKIVFKFKTFEEMLPYDLIVFQRQFEPQVLEVVNSLKALKKKVVYELDDNMWDIPQESESYKFWTPERIASAEAIMKACNAMTTTTEPLAEILRQHNKNVFVIPNYIPEVNPLPKYDSVIKIGWSGSISHNVDFNDTITRALKDIKKKYRGKVELVFCGWIPEDLVGHVTFYEPVPPMYYLNFLNQLRLHIGIMPCAKTNFNECKSNLKFLEYSITRTASIASPINPYINTIAEDTGILLKDESYEDWFGAIDRLVADADLRNRLANNAYDFVRNNYLITNNIQKIEKTYQEILALP
jgi:O-antigen biosynthesis protein